MNLTEKQERFCQEYIKSGVASQAYRIAYPKSKKWKDESVNVNASKTMANTNIMQRVKELQEKVESKHDISKDKIMARLQQLVYEQEVIGADKLDLNVMIKALDTLNKMMGYYAPEKKEHSGEVAVKSGMGELYKAIK